MLAFVAGELLAVGKVVKVALHGAQINFVTPTEEAPMQFGGGGFARIAGQ